MASPSAFALILALLACLVLATTAVCPDSSKLAPNSFFASEKKVIPALQETKDGITTYWCERAVLLAFANDLPVGYKRYDSNVIESITNFRCDQSGNWHAMLSKSKNHQVIAIDGQIKSMQCVDKAKCRVDAPSIGKCPLNNCKPARLDAEESHFECDSNYQLETYDSFRKIWDANEKLQCVDQYIVDYDSNVQFRCREKKDESNVCSYDQYFDEVFCNEWAVCERPTRDGNCVRGYLTIYSAQWHHGNYLTCDTTRRIRWQIGSDTIAPPEMIACIVATEHCAMRIDDFDCAPNDECSPTSRVGQHERYIVCRQGMHLEAKSDNWYLEDRLNCFENTAFAIRNGISRADLQYSKTRCRKPRECIVDNYYSDVCDKTRLCHKPIENEFQAFHCEATYHLQYTTEVNSVNWISAEGAKCILNYLIIINNGVKSDIVPNRLRCVKEKKCYLDNFYVAEKCADTDNDCEKPIQLPDADRKALKCDGDFGLQAKFKNASKRRKFHRGEISKMNLWEDIQSAVCSENLLYFQLVDKKGVAVPAEKYAIGYRCARKNIDKFYDNAGCQTQICDKPQHCKEMKCPNGLTLFMKLDDGSNWVEVQSARCNSGTFIGTLIDRTTLATQAIDQPNVKVKCAREKCAYCENPCPSCKPEFNAIFTKSTKWDECSTFECGPHTRTIFYPQSTSSKSFENAKLKCSSYENGQAKWDVNGETIETQEIKCEKLCTLNSPLDVKCDPNDFHCVEVALDNDNPFACSRKLFFAENKRKMVEISNLHCNKLDGQWRATRKDGNSEIMVPKDGKISCHYGCDIVPYNTQLCDEDSVCEPLLPDNTCPRDFGLQAKFDDKSPEVWFDIVNITCSNHRLFAYNYQEIKWKFPHDFRCIHKNVTKFFDSSDCTTQEDCEQPKNCTSLTCEMGFALQSKTATKPEWSVADVLRCNSNKFTGRELKGVIDVNRVRCVRLKCTTCNDPCPTCKPEFKAIFAKSTKWNECATFECGTNTRTTFHPNSKQFTNAKIVCNSFENGAAKWSENGEVFDTKEVKCEKLCTLNSLLDTKCNPNDSHCEEVNLVDDSPISCTKQLYFTTTTSPLMNEISTLYCDKLTGLWTGKKNANAKAETVPTGSKIHCHHGCDSHAYFKSVICEKDDECHEPKLQDKNPCKSHFGLQAKFENASVWTDIANVTCSNQRFHIFGVDQKKIEKFPHEIRCIRKKIGHFFDNSTEFCDDERECKQPDNCASMKCHKQWALQITKSKQSPIIWTDVDSLRCDSDKFTGSKLMDVKEVNKVRCVRLQCTRCENPCPTCLSSPITSWKFTPSTKWNECSKFECGNNTHTMLDTASEKFDNAELVCHSIGDQGKQWNIGKALHVARKVECENSCALRHPLVSECSPNDFCEEWVPEDDEPNTCPMKMFYKSPQAGLVAISKLSCNKISGAWEAIRKDNNTTDVISEGSSLSCHAGCHIPFYFPICDMVNDCEEPTMSEDSTLSCRDEFGLQVDYGHHQTPLGWQDVDSVLCEKHRFKVYDKENVEISAFPKGIRCIRKNLAHFLHGCDATKEDCQIPNNCTSLVCETQWNLQVRFGTNPWSQIQSASCNSDKFSIFKENGEKSTEQPTAVRCVRLKCSSCSTPCPNCHVNSQAIFKQSTKWNECAEFTCDSQAHLVIDSNSEKIRLKNAGLICESSKNNIQSWITKDGLHRTTNDVKCENSCEQKSPLTSKCKVNSTTCEKLKPSVFECPKKMFYENNGIPEEIMNLACDLDEGIWRAIRAANQSEIIIPIYGNVYCHAGDCEIDRIFPTCNEDECEEFLREGNRFYCTGTSSFWSRESYKEEWVQMKGVKDLFCIAGSIVIGGETKGYDFQATCRIVESKAQTAGSKVPQNFAIVTLILILIVIIIATILLRVSGQGWLHMIIFNRLRGKKRKSHKSAISSNPSKKYSKKSASSNSHSSGSTSKSRKPRPKGAAKPRPSSSQSSTAHVSSEEATNKMNDEPKTNVYHI